MPSSQPQTSHPGPQTPVNILAVLVVYKQQPASTVSLQTLLTAQSHTPPTAVRLGILVYDNTPSGQDPGPLPDAVLYRAAPDNPGLARPYNEALRFAQGNGFDWLLTLDQDTHLPPNFLNAMAAHAAGPLSAEVGAIVPEISDHGRVISPLRYLGGFLPVVLGPKTRGLAKPHTSAINSAALLRVSALAECGGYDERFPLHNSDTRLFQRLDRQGKRLCIARDVTVAHELAILQRQQRITPERYARMLNDECFFWDAHMGLLGRAERLVRLLGRVCKGYLRRENPAFRKVTEQEMLRRLRTSRKQRLQQHSFSRKSA